MSVVIRAISKKDRQGWERLWRGYQAYYEVDLSSQNDLLFARLMDGNDNLAGNGPFALVAEEGDQLLGFTHYLFHSSTWSPAPRCYLQDLFTAEDARGKGIGHRLIEAVYDRGRERGVDQVYWLTQDFNHTAKRLYDHVATSTPFVKYMKKL